MCSSESTAIAVRGDSPAAAIAEARNALRRCRARQPETAARVPQTKRPRTQPPARRNARPAAGGLVTRGEGHRRDRSDRAHRRHRRRRSGGRSHGGPPPDSDPAHDEVFRAVDAVDELGQVPGLERAPQRAVGVLELSLVSVHAPRGVHHEARALDRLAQGREVRRTRQPDRDDLPDVVGVRERQRPGALERSRAHQLLLDEPRAEVVRTLLPQRRGSRTPRAPRGRCGRGRPRSAAARACGCRCAPARRTRGTCGPARPGSSGPGSGACRPRPRRCRSSPRRGVRVRPIAAARRSRRPRPSASAAACTASPSRAWLVSSRTSARA